MTVARSLGVFIGTDDTTGVTITNNSTTTGSEIDLLGADTNEGHIRLFLRYTGTTAAGTINVTIYPSRVSGKPYADQAPVNASIVPINGTQYVFLGDWPISRFMTGKVLNNAIGTSLTNLTLGYELFVES